jgi:hypothetical protein
MNKMFDNDRYITRGIQQQIPLELQPLLWNYIDALKKQCKEMDYLQVFELTADRADDIFFQKIEHSQEVPAYSKTYIVFAKEMVSAKVFAIDDGDHSTMLLAEEY